MVFLMLLKSRVLVRGMRQRGQLVIRPLPYRTLRLHLSTKRSSLTFDGTNRVVVPQQAKFALSSWTVDAWICPSSAQAGRGVAVRRAVADLGAGLDALNYEIGVERAVAGDLLPYVRVIGTNGTEWIVGGATSTNIDGNISIVANGTNWTHIAGSFDETTHVLALYVNSVCVGTNALNYKR